MIRALYNATARLADLATGLFPQTTNTKFGRTFAARRNIVARYERWAATGRNPNRPLLWIHAPSVGEGLMALPLVQRVRAELPDVQIAYTFFSPSAERFAAEVGADFAEYLPFDSADAMTQIVTALRPTALMFSKLDVWPVLVDRAHNAGVKLGLVSASMPERSRRYGIGGLITRDAYRALDLVGAASRDDAQRLVIAGVQSDRVRVTGDTRYDQAWARAHETRQNATIVDALRSTRPTLVAGSTWGTDEAHLLPAWEQLVRQTPDARLIIAPHEIAESHLQALERWADRMNLRHARFSAWNTAPASSAVNAPPVVNAQPAANTIHTPLVVAAPPGITAPSVADTDVIIVDRMGILADLYALATVAYVGGGFHAAGLHSVVEPAVFHVPTIIGPKHESSRDAVAMRDAGGIVVVSDTIHLASALKTLFSRPTALGLNGMAQDTSDFAQNTSAFVGQKEHERMSRALAKVVSGELGAVDRSFEIVRVLLGRV